ncbi:cytospin-A-like isoform X8 [Neocloeon triangulifer]|uniref:cytospin-A-like isoform X8 n=1 Tax=Neocloeon triangulifer TaxID=2078957 RepID=UPI00286EBCD0|nr:cytospin-A-like isoform X8 [Neocloeon triangulifer]
MLKFKKCLIFRRSVTSPGSTSATPQQEKAKSAASRSGRANATRPPPPPQPETVTNNTPSQAENRPALAQNPPPAVADLEAKVLELTQMLQTKQAEVNMLKSELKEAEKEMATSAAAGNVQLKELRVENKTLKTKLAQLEASTAAATAANSTASQLQPLSDTEKLLLGQIHQHSSAPASIAGTEPPTPYDALGTDMLASTCSQGVPGTPDWEHQSLGSCSEVSVAGLQDRILQMEETHYSTSEELQATLQELADLQNQLSELQSDNSRLTDEKAVVLQSLCKQTERLEDCRARVESLTALLCSEGLPAPNDTEAKLLEIIKGLHEERSEHQGLIEAAEARVRGAQERLLAAETASARQNERVSVLQAQVEVGVADKKRLEDRLEATLREAQEKAIEHDRIENLLANAKAKIEELEECRTSPANETQLESRLESIRSEKEELEVKIVELQEQLAKAQGEVARIRETTNTLQEELKVSRNNARSQVSELEFVINQEREETKRAQAASTEQAAQAQRHLEDKRQLRATLSEAQRENLALKEELKTIQAQLDEEKRLRAEENDEWIQFRSDLLMTVRVANDFKTEAQQQLAKLVVENKALKEKNRSLEAELTKAKGESRCSSASNSIVTTPTSPSPSPCNTVPSTPSPIPPQVELSKSPLRDQQQNNRTSGTSLTRKTSFQEYLKEPVKPTKSEELPSAVTQRPRHFSNPEVASKDPLWALVKNGGSKRNALLKWCQAKTSGYKGIDITNFSSSWNDGLALCALIHSYLPALVPYNTLVPTDKRKNFSVAFSAAESVGIPTTLSIVEMTHMERPDWQQVMAYVTEVYKHFET